MRNQKDDKNIFFSNLNQEEREIILNKGTEDPFSGEYNDHFDAGIFICRACKSPLYESNTKFNSGCGWPSFDDEIEGSIVRYEDSSGGRIRTDATSGGSGNLVIGGIPYNSISGNCVIYRIFGVNTCPASFQIKQSEVMTD